MKKQNQRKEDGQVMVEAMVALSIIVIGILGIFTLTSTSITVNRMDADRYVAINLAAEGIELVKNLLDRNIVDDLQWNNLPCAGGGYCGADGNYRIDYNDAGLSTDGIGDNLYFGQDGGGYRYQEPGDTQQTKFNRQINIKNLDDSHIKVTSTVYWQSKNNSYDFSVVDYFYNNKQFKYNLNIYLNQ